MKTRPARIVAALLLFALATLMASAHPGSGIIADAEGQVYFQDAGKRAVWKIDTRGRLSEFHTGIGGHWMCLDEQGSFSRVQPRYFARITSLGAAPTILLADGGAPLVVSHDGNLYYPSHSSASDEFAPGGCQIVRVSPDGTWARFASDLTTTLEKLDGVTGLATGPDGSLYIASPTAVHRVRLDGAVSVIANPVQVTDCTIDAEPTQNCPFLRGLAVDADGTVFAAANDCRRVIKISPKGSSIETVLHAEAPWTPTGVALFRGRVYALEYKDIALGPDLSARVRMLDRDGRISTLALIPPAKALSISR